MHTTIDGLAKWHKFVNEKDEQALAAALAEHVVFSSPFLWQPKEGKVTTMLYLSCAARILEDFTYQREFVGDATGADASSRHARNRRSAMSAGTLWLVASMNPDGQAAQDRHNANQVDLNRNFPYNWQPLGEPGDGQYAGTGPASEPETQAMVNFIAQLRPDIAIWYHQDLYVISPSEGREGRIRARYAELTGLPMGGISGGTYTGIAATWARHELAAEESVAFVVELGATLTPEEATMHAEAVRTIAAEG